MKLDTLRKTALLAGGLRLLFLFLPQQYQEYCTQENCQLFVQWRVGFFCVEDDCRFGESFIKSKVLLRSMEWQLFAFVKIEENLPPGPQSPASIAFFEIYRKLKHITVLPIDW